MPGTGNISKDDTSSNVDNSNGGHADWEIAVAVLLSIFGTVSIVAAVYCCCWGSAAHKRPRSAAWQRFEGSSGNSRNALEGVKIGKHTSLDTEP